MMTKADRRSVQGSQRLKLTREVEINKEVSRYLNGMAREMGKAYKSEGKFGIDQVIAMASVDLTDILIRNNTKTAAQLGNWQMLQLEGKSVHWLDFQRKIFDREIAGQLEGFISENVEQSVFIISETSRNFAAKIVADLITEGESTTVIARQLSKQFKELTPFRAARIARTEVGTVGSKAQMQGAINLDSKSKQWIAIDDARTRNPHNDVDDNVLGMEEFFTPNGENMLHPHDRSQGASAGNIINCRCDVLYSR